MKYKLFLIPLLFSIITFTGNTAFAHLKSRYHTVISCKMTGGKDILLKTLNPIDGDKPYLEINGKTQLAFDKDFVYGSVTELMLTKCIRHTLIYVMDYGSPYLIGKVVRENPITHQYEHIYFAEKALPHWLYFKNNEWGVIIPNIGYETNKKYLVYTYKSGKNQPKQQDTMIPMNNFPVPKKDLIHIPPPKDLQ